MGTRRNLSCLFARFVILTLGLSASPLRAQGTANERVFFNAKIFTAEPESPYAEAIAIRGGKIVAVGTYAEVAKSVGAKAERIDLEGKSLFRGLLIRTFTRFRAAFT